MKLTITATIETEIPGSPIAPMTLDEVADAFQRHVDGERLDEELEDLLSRLGIPARVDHAQAQLE